MCDGSGRNLEREGLGRMVANLRERWVFLMGLDGMMRDKLFASHTWLGERIDDMRRRKARDGR